MGKVSVTDLTTAGAALGFCLAGAEGREVVMQQETLFALVQNIVHYFLIESGTESGGHERLRFATGENGASVRTRQIVHFAPDGADLVGLTAIQTDAFVQHTTAHGFFLHVMIIAFNHRHALVFIVKSQLLFRHLGEVRYVILAYRIERLIAPLLVGAAGLGDGIRFVVAFVMDVRAQCVVVDFVVVFAFCGLAGLFLKFHHGQTLLFDLGMRHFQGLQKFGFAHFVHFALHHHDVVVSGADHKFNVGFGNLLKSGVDDPFSVDACDAHFGDRTVERDVAARQGR